MCALADLPPVADVVIVGGGILGCAIAWYLSRGRQCDVLLLERRELAGANTSRAAALLTRGRSQACLVPLIQETFQAIQQLEAELDEPLYLRDVGCLHVSASPEKHRQLAALVNIARQAGELVYWVTPPEAHQMAPWLDESRVLSAAFMPDDGFIDPYTLACAYAHAAQQNDACLLTGVSVTAVLRAGGQVTGVETSSGRVSCPQVIDAAGAWAGLLASQVSCPLPMAPVRSHYWITAPGPLFPNDQPVVILPDACAYTRPELGGLLFGLREAESVHLDPRLLPDDLADLPAGPDPHGWQALLSAGPRFQRFFPAFEGVEIAHYISGYSTYTPDGLFLLGGLPGLDGFLAASGCSGAGIAASGGIARAIVDLALRRQPSYNLAPFRLDRFGSVDPFSPEFLRRCAEARSKKTSG